MLSPYTKTSCRDLGHEASTTLELGTRGPSTVLSETGESNNIELLGKNEHALLLDRIKQLEEENDQLRKMAAGVQPDEENLHKFWPRLGWLLGLLLLQSISSIILKSFHDVMQSHPSIVYFLTMLVGAGGNVGGQSAVLVVRGLATNRPVAPQIIVGMQLALFLGLATLCRTLLQGVAWRTSLALTTSMSLIVVMGCSMGQAFPLMYQKVGIDPAHSSATIQVFMDIAGISLTCIIVWLMLSHNPLEPVDEGIHQYIVE